METGTYRGSCEEFLEALHDYIDATSHQMSWNRGTPRGAVYTGNYRIEVKKYGGLWKTYMVTDSEDFEEQCIKAVKEGLNL